MSKDYEKLEKALAQIRAVTDFEPQVALILGSGLGSFAQLVDKVAEISYADIEGFPVSTVQGHSGRFVFGTLDGVKVCVMQGRVHYYEGYSPAQVVMPTRLMAMLGAKILFLTNAAGGINPDYQAGDFMVISDHVMTFFPNPLVGENIEDLGTRFPDMSHVYDPALRAILRETAQKLDIPVQEGVYVQVTGPSFETPAEIRMLEKMGCDAVGMSTACEAVAARHAGMRVCGISCISNLAAGRSPVPLTHAEVQEAADKAAPQFRALVRSAISAMAEVR